MLRRVSATAVLTALTAIVSLVITALGRQQDAGIYAGFLPARASGYIVVGAEHALPWWITPLSATLVHVGTLHLLYNLVILFLAGRATEKVVGTLGTLILYLVGAYVSAAAQWLYDPLSTTMMVGASGAISALVGAYAMLYGRPRARTIGPIPARVIHILWLAAGWTLLNFLFWIISRHAGVPIAIAAHVGGFIAGLLLARPLLALRWLGA